MLDWISSWISTRPTSSFRKVKLDLRLTPRPCEGLCVRSRWAFTSPGIPFTHPVDTQNTPKRLTESPIGPTLDTTSMWRIMWVRSGWVFTSVGVPFTHPADTQRPLKRWEKVQLDLLLTTRPCEVLCESDHAECLPVPGFPSHNRQISKRPLNVWLKVQLDIRSTPRPCEGSCESDHAECLPVPGSRSRTREISRDPVTVDWKLIANPDRHWYSTPFNTETRTTGPKNDTFYLETYTRICRPLRLGRRPPPNSARRLPIILPQCCLTQ